MFDFTKMIPPEHKALLTEKIPQFMAEWSNFMNGLGLRQKAFDAKLDSVDSKLSTVVSELGTANERLLIIMSESNLTPELHSDVLGMAPNDPRNQVTTQ